MHIRYAAVIAFLLGGCNAFPWLEKKVQLPDGSTVVRIMIRSGGEYRTMVENEWGSASDTHSPIGGGHRRTNLYLTPHHQLVTIEAGGDSARFDISPGKAPKALTSGEAKYQVFTQEQREAMIKSYAAESYQWRYVGMVYQSNNGLAYFSPKVARECIPLLGAGASNFRPKYQSEQFCPN